MRVWLRKTREGGGGGHLIESVQVLVGGGGKGLLHIHKLTEKERRAGQCEVLHHYCMVCSYFSHHRLIWFTFKCFL